MNFRKSDLMAEIKTPLLSLSILMLVATLVFFILHLIDPMLVSESPRWIKPIKFTLSIGIYSITLYWILRQFPLQNRKVTLIVWGITLCLFFEIIAIGGQAARGVSSHFNVSTPFNATVFSLMGLGIGTMWFLHLMITLFIFKENVSNRLLKETILWGMGISAIGMITGFLMTMPKPEQIELFAKGIVLTSGSHSFGTPIPGQEIPLLGWSKSAGDMRVPHFFGIHAFQFFILVYLIRSNIAKEKQISKYTLLGLRLIGLSYLSVTILLVLQTYIGFSIFQTNIFFLSMYLIFGVLAILGMILMCNKIKQQQLVWT
ncbi:putative membrane protein [Leptospira ryugenii]|uniref:Putative membrane protein n=1 Tax=Leptospira ryugenii TaxID=1917863 RepID=A0A2P2E1Y7_9LEPT|nr:hypothetical protein [Leptospira ryugenii]GBF50915.1 putative membrane protein [Leptospira ryugenii]